MKYMGTFPHGKLLPAFHRNLRFFAKMLKFECIFLKMLTFIRETYYGPKTCIGKLSKLAQIASPLQGTDPGDCF